jgi:hypothetical protein
MGQVFLTVLVGFASIQAIAKDVDTLSGSDSQLRIALLPKPFKSVGASGT